MKLHSQRRQWPATGSLKCRSYRKRSGETPREAIHPLLKQWFQRFRRYVSSGETGSASGNDNINLVRKRPVAHLVKDLFAIISDNGAGNELVSGLLNALNQSIARFVIVEPPVSDTVSTAMPTGMKGRLSSMRLMCCFL